MEAMRPPAAGFYPVSAAELGRQPAYDEHEPVVTYAPVQLGQLGEQEGYLRAAEHYAVEPAGPPGSHHVTEEDAASGSHHAPDKDGGSAFCVQAVAPFVTAAAELDKAVSEHEQQYLVSDLGAASYQLSAAGDVYKLVVRDAKQHEAELHHYGQLLPESLSAAPAEHPLPPPTEEEHSPPPPAPSAAPQQHCLVCDLGLANHRVLDIFGNTTHQTSTTYAIKLRQVTGHRANFVYHSEVLCESCASLLNVVDSFEARLREIKNRLEETRAEVQAKFGRTCARYDEEPAVEVPPPPPPPPPPLVEAPAVKSRKRRSPAGEASPPPTRKKVKGKAGADRDTNYRDKSKPSDPADIAAAPRRRPARKAVDKARLMAEYDADSPPEPDSFLEGDCPSRCHGANSDGTCSCQPRVLNRCPVCHVVQDNLHVFRVHLMTHASLGVDGAADHLTQRSHDRLTYGCSRCPETFAKLREQQRHVRSAHPRYTRCPVCLTQVEESDGLLAAHQTAHPAHNRCSFCPLAARSLAELGAHTADQHPLVLRSLYCELCRSLVGEPAFAGHVRAEHVGVPELSVQCALCGETVRRSAYAGHVRVHEATFRCQYCTRTFPSSRTLVVHERTHTGERPFACAQCQRPFISKATLDAHVAAFHRTNKHACDRCERTFPSQSRLQRHQRSHADTKPFTCQVCQKGFSLENHLNLHVRAIHLGETPHECHVCQKRFPYKSSLKEHMHVHTGDKSYCCHACGRRFRTAKILRSHSYTHRTEKPYKCDVRQCERSFSRKDLLARHRLSSHGIQPEVRYSRLRSREGVPRRPPLYTAPPTEVQFVLYQTAPRPAEPPAAEYPS